MNSQPPTTDHRQPGDEEPPDVEVLAGELALGVLDAAARREAEARCARDAAFAAQVLDWQRRLAPLLFEIAPVSVPADLWKRLHLRLGWSAPSPVRGFLNSLALWRGVAAIAAVFAIALWLTRPAPVAPPATVAPGATEQVAKTVTPLSGENGAPGWLASVDAAHGTILMVPAPRPADPQGRVAELWIIPAGRAPRSLGAISTRHVDTIRIPGALRPALVAPGSVLAVTLESATGMPHAAPSGPVIAKGAIAL